MSTATQASLPSRVAVRWYQLAVIVLGLALAAVTALAVYLAVNNPTPAAVPTPGPVVPVDQPCWKPNIPC
jgi:hypothetical protein